MRSTHPSDPIFLSNSEMPPDPPFSLYSPDVPSTRDSMPIVNYQKRTVQEIRKLIEFYRRGKV